MNSGTCVGGGGRIGGGGVIWNHYWWHSSLGYADENKSN